MKDTATPANEVAKAIYLMIDTPVLMSLGMHNPATIAVPGPGLTFLARILPFRKDGQRGSSARVMTVKITRNSNDLYDIVVSYAARRTWAEKVHFEETDIYPAKLNTYLLALDYDGKAVLNPRLIGA